MKQYFILIFFTIFSCVGSAQKDAPCHLPLTLSSNAPVCEGNELHLSAQGGTSYQWTGPDGFFSSDQNPVVSSFTTLNAGYYYVTATDANGCTGTDSLLAQLLTAPYSDFNISSCPVMNNLVQFTASDTTADNWQWTFDQNTHTSSGMHVLHGFNEDGYHCITLTTTNQCGTVTDNKTIYVYPNECVCGYTYTLEDTTITTSHVITINNYPNGIYIKGDIHIAPGVSISLEGITVYCAPDARIIVEQGGKLFLQDNVTLTGLPSPCSYMWQGIEVWGYDSLTSTSGLQGLIYGGYRSKIELAHIGILQGMRNMDYVCDANTVPFIFSSSGGLAKVNEIIFDKDGYGAMIIHKTTREVVGSFAYCHFLCSGVLTDVRYSSLNSIHYPTRHNPWVNSNTNSITNAGIWAEFTSFECNSNNFSNLKRGLELYDTRNYILSCNFYNCTYGIYIQNYLSAIDSQHEISQCTFDKIPGTANTFGAAIYLRAGRYDFIHDNTFGVDHLNPQSNNNYAIFANNSKSFNISQNIFFNFITGVNIINSGADGGYVGAGNTTSSISLGIWEGNSFISCRTNIITSGNNTALRLKCNNCYNNVTNLYTVNFNNYGQLANQGSMPPNFGSTSFKQKFAAGNAFYSTIAGGEKIVSQTSSYRYYHHSAPPEVIPDVSTSPFPINLNSINIPKTSTHVACPPPTIIINSTTLNADYAKALYTADSLKQTEESLKNNLALLTNSLDKDRTEELLNDIYGNTSNGPLKNKLLSCSPLSDTVLIALQVENPLSPGNYKNVMEKNLPVSPTVEPWFYERLKTLPAGIAKQLSTLQAYNPSVITPTALQIQIDYTYIERQTLLNQLIITLNDSLNNRKQDAIALLEQENTNESRQVLASTYIADGNYTLALNKLMAIDTADADVQEWKELTSLLLNLYQEGKTLYQLNTNQLNYIRELSGKCPATLASVNAQAILSLLFNEEFEECPTYILNKTKPIITLHTKNNIKAYLGDNYPEPFSTNTIIPYYLPDNKQGSIVIYNVLGSKVSEHTLTNGENILELNTSEWQQGVYIYTLFVEQEPIETKQMILVK